MHDDDHRADAYGQARNALSRPKVGRDYLDWTRLGALVQAYDEALEAIGMAGSNLPPSLRLGGGGSKRLSAILKRRRYDRPYYAPSVVRDHSQFAIHRNTAHSA